MAPLPADYKRQEQLAIQYAKDYNKPQVAIPRAFNEAMGIAERVLSVPVSTGLQIASMLEDPFNLDPDTPKQTELLAQVAGQGMETHLKTIKSAAVGAGINPEHVDAAGNLLELASLKPGIEDVAQRTKNAAFQQLAVNAPVVHAMGRGKGKLPSGTLSDHAISHNITPEGVKRVYGTTKLGRRVLGSDAHSGMHSPIFHHIIGKKIRYRFQQKLQQFDLEGGKGRLEALDRKYDLEAGSGDAAGLTMDQPAHGHHHDVSRLKGVEPWDTKKGKTLSQLKRMIDNAKSIKELEGLYDLYLRASVRPDLDHAITFQRGYESLGSPKTITRADLVKAAEEWDLRDRAIREVKQDKLMRQLGEEAVDEDYLLNSGKYNALNPRNPTEYITD
tara:strand:- start:1107 stop:2270 length:1164 start_codon:yes stop_codon:yes gene_type:complete